MELRLTEWRRGIRIFLHEERTCESEADTNGPAFMPAAVATDFVSIRFGCRPELVLREPSNPPTGLRRQNAGALAAHLRAVFQSTT